MSMFEYKVIPAPTKGLKAKGIKTNEARFAHALTVAMNDLATEGWEYLRSDSLPMDERKGWGKHSTKQNMLVFRRAVAVADPVETAEVPHAEVQPHAPAPHAPAPQATRYATDPQHHSAVSDEKVTASPRLGPATDHGTAMPPRRTAYSDHDQ